MTKKEIYNQVKFMEQKLSQVYYEIMDAEEISFYHNYAINEKLLLLTDNLENLVKEYELISKAETLKILCLVIMSVLNTIGFLIFILMQNPYVLATLLFGFYTTLKGMNLCKQDTSIDANIQNILHDMSIIATNCETFINKKMKINELRVVEELEDQKETVMDFYLANNILQNCLENSDFEIPNDNVKQIIVKMLQEDLHTDVNDINILISQAKERINKEKLREEMILTRKNA